jgi:putative flippase GtrA
MNPQTFRYAVCGSSNVVLSFISFTVIFHFVFKAKVLDLGFYAIESYNVALFVSSIFSFIYGFVLLKYIVFDESNLKGRIQLFRYFLSYISNLIINYLLLKLLVRAFGLYPVLAQIIVTVFIIILSYLTQRYFTFKVKKH